MNNRLRLRWFYLAGLAVLGAFLVVIFASRSPSAVAPVIMLQKPYRMPVPPLSLLERWIPATSSWAWFWHLKEAVFGRRRTVNLEASMVELTDSSPSGLSRLSLSAPVYSRADGLRVWFVPDAALDEVRRRLKQDADNNALAGPRISIGDKIAASLFAGETVVMNGFTNSVGWTEEVFTRVYHDSTDLTASILCSQIVTNAVPTETGSSPTIAGVTIRTNLELGARFQIPAGSGIFLIDPRHPGGQGKALGLILRAKLPAGKK